MSWGEVKKINGDLTKSLDTLIKEQFSEKFGSSGDISYIKNTQLGSNLNNLLQGSSSSTIDFNNKPLVDKINYLLLNSGSLEYDISTTSILASNLTEKRTAGGIGSGDSYVSLLSRTFLQNGRVQISADIKKDFYSSDATTSQGGIYFSKNGSSEKYPIINISGISSLSYTNKTGILDVKKGDVIEFYLYGRSVGAFYGKNFKVFGALKFINPYQK